MKKHLTSWAIAGWLFVSLVSPAHGQTTSAAILGTVTDQAGAVLPGVTVVITNADTGVSRTIVTGNEGAYFVPSLQPGNYRISAGLAGFATMLVEGIKLEVNQEQRRDIALQIGGVDQQVIVQANDVILDTENPVIGTVINERQIVDLPLDGRNFFQLAALSPGVTAPALEGAESGSARGRQSVVSISGQREYSTDVRIDGIPSQDFQYGSTSLSPNVDAISEFKVLRGYSSGNSSVAGRIDVVTKSGTNAFHGSAYEFVRNDKFDARNAFALTKLPFRQNQFGFTVGGPILKKNLFFFGYYEGKIVRRSSPLRVNVPTLQQLSGDFSGLATPIIDPQSGLQFPGNMIPANRISNFAKEAIKLTPEPNATGTANYVTSTRFASDDDQYSIRIDYNLSENDTIFGRFSHADSDNFTGAGRPFGGFSNQLLARSPLVTWNHTFNSKSFNSLKVGLNRTYSSPNRPEGADSSTVFREVFNLTGVSTNPECNQPPFISIAGFNTIGGGAGCTILFTNNYHVVNDFTFLTGRHRIGIGMEIVKIYTRPSVTNSPGANITFSARYTRNAVADFLLGIPTTAQAGFVKNVITRRAVWPSFYLSDNISVTRNLKLDLALRYDYFAPLPEDSGSISTFDRSVPGGGYLYPEQAGLQALGRVGPPGLIVPDKNNFSPRVGLAYSFRDRTTIRSSYGIFHQTPAGNQYNFQEQGPPFTTLVLLNGSLTSPTINIDRGDLFPAPTFNFRGSGVSLFGYDENSRTPYLQQWTLSVQRELPWGLLAEASYVGSKGTKLDKREDINIPTTPPPAGFTGTLQSRRPFPDFGFILYISNRGNSSYHGMQLALQKAARSNLTFLASYTWSKSLDQDSFDAKAARNFIPGDNGKSRSTFDQRQRFALSWVYTVKSGSTNRWARRLLDGWQVGGITTLQSGFPFHPVTSNDFSNRLSLFENHPMRTCDGNLPTGQRTPQRWFDTSCFPLPGANVIGNSGFHILDSDGIISQDMSLMRLVSLGERLRVQLRAEAFNLTNHTNYGRPVSNAQSPLFGQVTSSKAARIMQFGIKFIF
ncbi:MAG: TonB-dependent receptor [Acidobacteriota bacterium]|nr:TonB-dependent receptor [Acidobacteriota bacterium]